MCGGWVLCFHSQTMKIFSLRSLCRSALRLQDSLKALGSPDLWMAFSLSTLFDNTKNFTSMLTAAALEKRVTFNARWNDGFGFCASVCVFALPMATFINHCLIPSPSHRSFSRQPSTKRAVLLTSQKGGWRTDWQMMMIIIHCCFAATAGDRGQYVMCQKPCDCVIVVIHLPNRKKNRKLGWNYPDSVWLHLSDSFHYAISPPCNTHYTQ